MFFLLDYQVSLQGGKRNVVKYYFICLFFLLSAFVGSSVKAFVAYNAQTISGEALKAWHKGNIKGAIKKKERQILRTVAAFGVYHPDLVKDYLFLAILCVMNRNYEQASSFIEKGLEVASKSSPKAVKDFYELRGLIHYQLGKYEKAQYYFKKAFENINSQAGWEEPQAVLSILCYIMRCAYQLGDLEQVILYGEMLASQAITSFLEKTAEVAEAYEMLANAYYRRQNYFEALYYVRVAMAIQNDLHFGSPAQIFRSHYLAFQVHETIHDFPSTLALLDSMHKMLRTTTDLSTSHHTSYLEEKYSFPISFKPLDRLLPTIKAEDVQGEIQKLREKGSDLRGALLFPPNSIPDHFQLVYPKKGLFLPILMILLSYGTWGGWIYSLVTLLKATHPERRRMSGTALLVLTLIFVPLSFYLLYIARSMMALSGIKVGFMQDTLNS